MEFPIERPAVAEVYGDSPDYPLIGYRVVSESRVYKTREEAEKRADEFVRLLPQYYR